MRSFTNFTQPFNIKPNITLTISATGVNTVYTYGREDILDLDNIEWEMPFTGGFAKTSNYRVRLSNELATLKDQIPNFIGAAVQLEVEINSNVFYPHVGRIRGYERDGFDPNKIELQIFDRFFDSKLFFPKELITDSFDTPHLEELLSGQPVYYGKHTRPFYHTAIDSDVSRLLGPRNVSSENHVNSVWFNNDFSGGNDVSLFHNLLINKPWNQQSGDTNFVDGGHPFETIDLDPSSIHLWRFTGVARDIVAPDSFTTIFTHSNIDAVADGRANVIIAPPAVNRVFNPGNQFNLFSSFAQAYVELQTPVIIFNMTAIDISMAFSIDTASGYNFALTAADNDYFRQSSSGGPYSVNSNFDVSSENIKLFQRDSQATIGGILVSSGFGHGGFVTAVFSSYRLSFQLASGNYKEFSVFSPIVESSDIAISQNPFAIIDDIASNHLSIEYLQNQSSDSQVNVQSYNFQCFFKERIPIADILDDFGRITQVNMWVGDSGMLNFRTFFESTSETVNNSLDTSHIFEQTFGLTERPIGSSVFEQDLASKLKVKYNFDFQKNEFQNTKVADKNNTAECDSLDAIDITEELERETKYILEEDTASYYLGNLVRKFARGNEFVNFTGGAQLFEMEIGDVFHLQNPIIVDSAANYQIIKLSTNYVKGTSQITAARLQ